MLVKFSIWRCLHILNIKDRIKKIDNEYSENEIYLEHGMQSLIFFYDLSLYNSLIVDINIERDKYDDTENRMKFISLYKQVYFAQRKKLITILKKIEDRTIVIFPEPNKEEIIEFLCDTWKYDDSTSTTENLYNYAEICIRRAINKTNDEIYLLRYYPSVYYNYSDSYIGGKFGYRYDDEILIYDKVNIITDRTNHFRLYVNDETTGVDKRSILNVFAFLNGCPNFQFLDNTYLNKKLEDLYQKFDLLDCIRLRHPNYLKSDVEKSIHLELPIIKNKRGHKIIAFDKMSHEGIFDLYHAALKQFEPLPRCVFLYRVFEYAAANHYKVLFEPAQYNPEDAIEYYLKLALNYNPNPLYYIDFGIKNAKPKLYNFFTVLKREARKILDEWSTAPFLSNKSPSQVIYITGRNFTVHGASGKHGARNMQYDYDKNYLHINNVNILLELIARYVIEILNPEIKNVVERRTFFYKERYKRLLLKNK